MDSRTRTISQDAARDNWIVLGLSSGIVLFIAGTIIGAWMVNPVAGMAVLAVWILVLTVMMG